MDEARTGFIILELRPERFGALRTKPDDLRGLAREAGADDLARVLDERPETSIERVVGSVPAERIQELEALAERRGFPREQSLTSFWRLDARKIDGAERMLDRLSKPESVTRAYFETRGTDPLADATDDVFAIQQLHLNAAPVGIDARWAWTQPHGCGETVGFVDLEQGWIFGHEDLPPIAALPGVPQDVNSASEAHGTAVMGIAVGVNNAVGIIGIAPAPGWASVASHFRASDGTSGHIADAIAAVLASGVLAEGDVLLIEYQDGLNRPIETDPVVWNAIELATALGTIVVEAGGNGKVDLDTVPALNRLDPVTFKDSRAVIVGACTSALDATKAAHDRWNHPVIPVVGSNFGARIDCHAFGENVVTAGRGATPGGMLGGTGPLDQYRSDFGGTSAAAAIVAGAAIALQGMHKKVKGTPLTPVDMRTALRTHGTPQGLAVPGHIGVMPDLKKAAIALGLARSAPAAPSNLRIQG